jgi:anti-sigma B factor antagonist
MLGESNMNSNLFERKTFLDGNLIMTNSSDIFSSEIIGQNIILKVNLLRATANEADLLKKQFNKLSKNSPKQIIVDLRSCSFVDSTFLSTIISFSKTIDAEIKLVVSNKKQLTIFRITKIDSLFKIFPTIDEAIA